MKMKIGIYGGSFNPVHFGHMGLVKWVIEHTDLDEIWMMVSPNNPLKDATTLADEQVRLTGVRQAIADTFQDSPFLTHVKASDFEFHLPRPSYSANTLRELQRTYPEYDFTLIIGEDNWDIFDHWRDWRFILDNFRIFIYPRRGQIQIPNKKTTYKEANIRFLAEAPYYDISSTELREKELLKK